jgi:hypothetical protein
MGTGAPSIGGVLEARAHRRVDAVILYPVQTAANLMAYEGGYFDRTDVVKLDQAMLALTIVVLTLTPPYWALLGLSPKAT